MFLESSMEVDIYAMRRGRKHLPLCENVETKPSINGRNTH